MATAVDYTVVMPVVSLRFSSEPVYRRLKTRAQRRGKALSAIAEQLIDEGLRMEDHPAVVFRDGPSGRRPALVCGPEIADVIGAIIGGDVPVEQRRSRAADLMAIDPGMVDAALAYYADYTIEIDTVLAENKRAADEAEAAWVRGQTLLRS